MLAALLLLLAGLLALALAGLVRGTLPQAVHELAK